MVIGFYMFFRGSGLLRCKLLIPNVPSSTVRSAALGLVEVSGTATGPYSAISPLSETECYLLSYAISRLGTSAALNQYRTAIYHNGLPSAESFLHQKQIGLRYVMSLADSSNRETLSHAFV